MAEGDERTAVQPSKSAPLIRQRLVTNCAVQLLGQSMHGFEFAGHRVQHRRAVQSRDLTEGVTIGHGQRRCALGQRPRAPGLTSNPGHKSERRTGFHARVVHELCRQQLPGDGGVGVERSLKL
jgi:hypothetical protein